MEEVEEVVNRSPKPTPEKVLKIFRAKEWFKEGCEMDLSKLPKRPAFSRTCRAVGWQSAPSRGSLTTGAWRRTTSGCARRARRLFTLP